MFIMENNKMIKKKQPGTLFSRLAPTNGMNRQKRTEIFYGYLFLSPNVLAVFVFMVIPIIYSLYLSLTQWDLITDPRFIGLDNFAHMFQDSRFLMSMKNTFLFSLYTIPTGIIISLFFALLLNQAIKGVNLYQAIVFMPVIVSMVAVAMVWRWIFNTEVGLLNLALDFFGISPVGWISTEKWALVSVAIVAVWKSVGFNMVILLAGLKGVPGHLYEAARIDGAGTLSKLFKITLPLLTPSLFFVTIMSILGSFQVFDAVFMLTSGGPGNSTNVIYYWIYRNAFHFFNMGYAAALSWIVFGILFTLTLLQFKLFGKNVNYELD